MESDEVQERRVIDAGDVTWDAEADVIVVGGGIAGAAAAFGALRRGAVPLVLERAPTIGGTFAKSAGAMWIPGNDGLARRGVVDDPADALRFVARCARPVSYDPASPTLGLDPWEYDLLDAYVRRGADVIRALEAEGVLTIDFPDWAPDYQARLPENVVKRGRVGTPMTPDGSEPLRGVGQAQRFGDELRRRGVDVRFGQRVVGVVTDEGGVCGVRVLTPSGYRHLRGRGGVVFASGGFTHSAGLRRAHLHASIFGGAAVHTNTGDFVRIAVELGVPLHGMSDPWMAPIPVELLDDGDVCPVFVTPGDSMIFLNRYGRRVLNEKGVYNEVARVFGTWDPQRMEYPNLLMFMVFDDRVRRLWGPPPGYENGPAATNWPLESLGDYSNDDRVVVSAPDLPALAQALDARLAPLAHLTGGLRLDRTFVEGAQASIARFNELATKGVDDDFDRGQNPIEHVWGGVHRPGNDLPEPTMYPIADGPLHAIILGAGTLDTRGGPRIDPDGRVLGAHDAPIAGLYGAGNCVASPFVQGYPAGGVPNGSAVIFGYAAGQHAGAAAASGERR
jgi:succinate dehydrogenase/fumarate reductase flavoprotein subunit